MDRRTFLLTSAAAAAATRFAFAATPDTLAKTASGTLRGETLPDGVRVFRGVPFAEPPIGPLRFRAPVPVKPWTGVREATTFGAAPMQPNSNGAPQSEDCLHLNIWAPADAGPHPVFVWIHGGGFTGGRAFEPLYDGTEFARAGIVCVSVAYRLGVFGFLDLSTALDSSYAGSANNALRDLTLALRWLQANLPAFGGDPKRVTIGGESAGAKLIDILMGAPASKDLFHQMISESGGAERVFPAARAAEIGGSFLVSSGLTAAMLKTAPAAALIAAQEHFIHETPIHFPLRPELDPTFLPRSPLDAMRSGNSRGKRLLLGTNRDESALFIGPNPAHDPTSHDLGNLTLEQFAPLEAKYAELYPDLSPELRRIRSLTAEEYWIPSLRVADAHLTGGGEAFVYRYDFSEPTGRYANRAFHSSELRFVWDRLPASATPADHTFANTLHTAWASFIRGETPAAAGLPPWPAYNTTTRPTMLLDTTSRVENNPQAAELAVWEGLLTH